MIAFDTRGPMINGERFQEKNDGLKYYKMDFVFSLFVQ